MKNDQVLMEWKSVLNIIQQHVQRIIRTKCGLKFWGKRICKSKHKKSYSQISCLLTVVCKR